MGHWILESATPTIKDGPAENFGNRLAVEFKLHYKPSTFGSFVEMPRLEWKETITMIEKNLGTWWRYVGDQYQRNPNSVTFVSWVMRYAWAFDCVRGQLYNDDVPCRLYDKHGGRIPKDTFERTSEAKDKANVVRAYLKMHGGIMCVMVEDKPAILRPSAPKIPPVHKNRILTFDCGLKGSPVRIKAVQHLTVDDTKPPMQWFRECLLTDTSRPFTTVGLREVQPPAEVAMPKPFDGNAAKGQYE